MLTHALLDDESPTHFPGNHSFCFSLSVFLTYFSVSLPMFLFSSLDKSASNTVSTFTLAECKASQNQKVDTNLQRTHLFCNLSLSSLPFHGNLTSKTFLFLPLESNSFCHKEFVIVSKKYHLQSRFSGALADVAVAGVLRLGRPKSSSMCNSLVQG